MTPLVPPVSARLTGVVPSRRRDGVTLLELVVVLMVLGITAAFVLPSFIFPRPSVLTLDVVAQHARARAIARAQPLTLAVGVDGRWMLATLADGQQHVDSGQVEPPGAPLTIDVSPVGRCALRGGSPTLAPAWDAVRCASGRRS
ncbi:MAG: prepilin-type N-terminal cleavage/methylation domain-containing protein [Cytophagaceae bacterium]|nr:prepilin-type N-terminal cleavage/methylation domain-containing protein [Gemmatimonadaceae bacterium]